MNHLALAASLLLWGWHTGRLWLALVLLAALALGALQNRRWHLGDGDWQRVLLVSAVLLIGVAVYAANVATLPASLFVGISWLPLALFPLVLVQRMSADPGVPLSVFLAAPAPGKYLDFALPFAAATLLAAASANTRSAFFLPALVAACALGLWPLRRPGVNLLAWMGTLAIAGVIGMLGADGLQRAQTGIEAVVLEWLASDTLDTDSERATTRIGTIGRIKLSGKLVLRVRAPGAAGPLHLAEAAYDDYGNGVWFTHHPGHTALGPGNGVWNLGGVPTAAPLRIEARLAEGHGVLALPLGTARIANLAAQSADRNKLGSVRVEGAATLVSYDVQGGGPGLPPGADDLAVPASLVPALRAFETEAHLGALPPNRRVAALTRYFEDRYRYTLDLGRDGGRTLTQFLTADRAGHCEYFASAATLLLRQSGIPARYVVGFLAHDYSDVEHAWLVRSHDAHAWAIAWIDGAWRIADTTPGNWAELEAQNASPWDPAALALERAGFAARAWWHEDPDAPLEAGGAALLVGLTVLVWLWRKQRSEASRVARAPSAPTRDPYAGTAFADIAVRLCKVSPPLGAHETVRQWIERAQLHPRVQAAGPLGEILALHYPLRYDPRARAGESELRQRVRDWARRFDQA